MKSKQHSTKLASWFLLTTLFLAASFFAGATHLLWMLMTAAVLGALYTLGRGRWWSFVAAALVLPLSYGIGPGRWFTASASTAIVGAPVRRGPLRISVVQHGNLAAKDSVSLKSELEGQTTIIHLIEEGKFVQPGDLLVELDSSDLVERKVQQEIAFQNADAAYTKAKAAFEIQDSQNKSDVELAERRLKFAEIDREKYLQGDWLQLSGQAEDKILLARQELVQAENTFNWSKSLAEKGFLTKTELDRDELEFNRAEVQLKQSERAKELLAGYDDPRRRTELEANLKEAERGLERTKLQAQSRIADYEAGLRTSEARLKLEQEKLAKYVDQLAKARILSPVAGMIVYTRSESGRMGSGEPMQEGSQVRERQEILTIPRTVGMIAEASVHESVLQQVTVGLSCTLMVDALKDQEFAGRIEFVALLADKASWWANPNQRLYRTEISITDPSPEMRPGMSCSIEILAEEIPDTLFVPLQCVLLQKGQNIAFVSQSGDVSQRVVKVGKNNDKWVQILGGLSEGEIVLLSPPAGFALEGQDPSKAAANGARRDSSTPRPNAGAGQNIGPPGSRAADGRAADGRAADGRATDGRATDGRATDGRAMGSTPAAASVPAMSKDSTTGSADGTSAEGKAERSGREDGSAQREPGRGPRRDPRGAGGSQDSPSSNGAKDAANTPGARPANAPRTRPDGAGGPAGGATQNAAPGGR